MVDSPSGGAPAMAARWDLVDTKGCGCGIIVHPVNLRHLLQSIPMDMCFVSQLERCCYVSFRELILSCSIFEKIDPSRVSFFSPCHVGRSSQSKTARQRW